MRIGVLTFITDEGIGPVELGVGLEQRGLESLFLAEHSHIPVDAKTPYPGGRSHSAEVLPHSGSVCGIDGGRDGYQGLGGGYRHRIGAAA